MRITRDMATEVSQSAIAAEDCELFCTACDTTLMLIPRGALTFHSVRGGCSCSWHCCPAAEPENATHANHIDHRARTGNVPVSDHVPEVWSSMPSVYEEPKQEEVSDERA